MTDEQIRDLIDRYQFAFNAYDRSAIVDLFDERSAIIDAAQGTDVFNDREELSESIDTLLGFYRSIGVGSVEAARVTIEHISDEAAAVDIAWRLRLSGQTISFGTRYWVVARSPGPRIASVLAYSERESWPT